MVEYTISHHLI